MNAGYIDTAIASTSSHFSTAERQFRFPLNYGGVRTPTAQWTATAAGAALVGFSGKPPFIRAATVGKIEDMGITDLNNMGAAMAGAAYDTLTRHMKHRGTHPQDYDVIITGDLGQVGSDLLYDLFQRDGVSLREHHKDCGLMIYDRAAQDVHAGGSGCGCSASMMCGHFFKRIQAGELKRVLYCATGALMSPTVVQQGGSIPGMDMFLEYVWAFLIGGAFCAVGQLLIDLTKLTPARILVSYVVAGVVLGAVGVYDPIIEFAGGGATVPLTGFGNLLAKGVREAVDQHGLLGAFMGGFTATAAGIAAAVFFGLLAALCFKSGSKINET